MVNVSGKMTNRTAGSKSAGYGKQYGLLVRELLACVVLLRVTTRCDRILLLRVRNPAGASHDRSASALELGRRRLGIAYENSTPSGNLSPTFRAAIFGAGHHSHLATLVQSMKIPLSGWRSSMRSTIPRSTERL